MLPSEGLNDITEDPISDLGEDNYIEDDEFDEELDIKQTNDTFSRNPSSRPTTNHSTGSQIRNESRRLRSKQPYKPLLNINTNKLKRDPVIDSIIESRKSVIIENLYTSLAQTTSQTLRSSQKARLSALKSHQLFHPKTANQVHFNDINDQNDKNKSLLIQFQFDNQLFDDELNTDNDKENMKSKTKSVLQAYEETCKRLQICPCSLVSKSLHTTSMRLENYGLGAKGVAALAVVLVSNTSVLSLNLSGNNIGPKGMSYIYQVLTENSFIEEYDLSHNNLGANGLRKLAAAVPRCVHLTKLNIAGNELTGSDINHLLSKLEDNTSLTDLNISHNKLDEEGGIYVAKWLSENSTLVNFNISWCCIRLMGARALAKSIGDNTKLNILNLSHNSFTNDTIEILTNSLTRNTTLKELNLSGNEIVCRYDVRIRDDPSILILGKEALLYKLFLIAATNQSLKIFRLGKNHLDARCIMIILEALSKLDSLSLEELDLAGSSLNSKQMSDIHKLFENHTKLTCYVELIRQTVEQFANNLLNSIHKYCQENKITVPTLFGVDENSYIAAPTSVTYEQFQTYLKKAKIPYPVAQIENIMKYLGREDEDGKISFRSL